MHPKEIIAIFKKAGADLTLDAEGIVATNAKQVSELTLQFAKENKRRLIMYLKGEYTDKKHSIFSTNDQLVDFFLKREVNNPKAIDAFLRNNSDCADMVIRRMQILKENGWKYEECTANYENEDTDLLAELLFKRAMADRKKKGA
ncbi:hypothetical protein Q5W88_01285 [Shouchella clausii]|uniref:hypothetical protein n=1 Tax=Shouchella clausii TaxID=79880 RepID=UPI0026F46602|nr:hypothetical protein [Shouchella clausii]MDO7281766.1 hypothetical protein [Shouchella clausii]MDO7301861.1 hypothetical protein [Shouchella clausii]